jgi:hypothetical protein
MGEALQHSQSVNLLVRFFLIEKMNISLFLKNKFLRSHPQSPFGSGSASITMSATPNSRARLRGDFELKTFDFPLSYEASSVVGLSKSLNNQTTRRHS